MFGALTELKISGVEPLIRVQVQPLNDLLIQYEAQKYLGHNLII